MNKLYNILFVLSLLITLQFLSCTSKSIKDVTPNSSIDVILFLQDQHGCYPDIKSYENIASNLGLSNYVANYQFINERGSFFDKNGQRKFRVLIMPGGEYQWEEFHGNGFNCEGVNNILDFVKSGGSVITLCISSSSIFSSAFEWINPNIIEAKRGMWDKKHFGKGGFNQFCGVYAFNGVLRGPQESNRPYPTTRVLPIKMNPTNEIVREGGLPKLIYQMVFGGGSIIPDDGQPLDVVGWYPNDTIAIAIVPYGQGRIIMSNPHPNITGSGATQFRLAKGLEDHAKRWGWTEEMIAKQREFVKSDIDPDGPQPDWALAKAMLSYAYKRASK